jgi:hypothetical protein
MYSETFVGDAQHLKGEGISNHSTIQIGKETVVGDGDQSISQIVGDAEAQQAKGEGISIDGNHSTIQIGKETVVGEKIAIDILRKDESLFEMWNNFVSALCISYII